MERYALIVAGGNGTRMGAEIPKQFLVIAGKPILMHTLTIFYHLNCKLVLVIPENQFEYWNDLCQQCAFTLPLTLIAGGSSRFHSVQNGLASIPDDSLVAIHDGVRPCIVKSVIEATFDIAARKGNAITTVLPKDSIRLVNGEQNTSVDRALYRLIQTPQTFQSTLIKKAYAIATHHDFTDDAGVLEAAGHSIELVNGDYKNIKVTTPEDLIVAEIFLKQRS
jgi:2-C-methyl-D-erythritol 4-phosphate cytidylyltransferase